MQNVTHFVEFVVRVNQDGGAIRHVQLNYCKATVETESALTRLQSSAEAFGVQLEIDYVPKFHERHIRCADG